MRDVVPAEAGDFEINPRDPQALATLIYTSGTTGRPKGVMLSHFALLWNAEAAGKVITPRADDVFLSHLPLAHAFERTVGYYLAMMGGSVVAYARSIDLLKDDIAAIRPTVFLSVPHLYERLAASIRAQAAHNPLERWLLDTTASLGWRRCSGLRGLAAAPNPVSALLWKALDQLVATRVRRALGGRLRAAVSGGAPLDPDVAQFLIGLGVPLTEGYGLTEAGPVVTAAAARRQRAGFCRTCTPWRRSHYRGTRRAARPYAFRHARLLARRGDHSPRQLTTRGGFTRAISPKFEMVASSSSVG